MDYRKIAKGVTVEHWSDKDILPDGTPTSRFWKQAGLIRQSFPLHVYRVVINQPWRWRIKMMVRMPDGSINTEELTMKTGMRLQEMDTAIKDFRDTQFAEFPDYVDTGWQAIILGPP